MKGSDIVEKKNNLMTEGVIWKQLLLFSIPLLIGNLFQQLYNTVDSIIVGNYVGSQALAAVGASTPIINLLVGFFMGIATGAGIIISQFYGAKDDQRLEESIHTSFALSIWAGIFLTVMGIVFSPLILRLMGTPEDIFSDSVLYLRIYFIGSLFLLIYNMGAGVLRAVGDSKKPLYYLCLSSIVNILLDLLFVIVFRMGVAGVALATLIAQGVSATLLTTQLIKSSENYALTIKKIKVHKLVLQEIIMVGIPTGLQQVIVSLSNAIVQSSINGFGSAAVAGCSAYLKLDGFMILPILSFGMASTTFTGQNLGARQYNRMRKGLITALGMTSIYTISVSILMYLYGGEALKIFSQEEAVLHYGRLMLNSLIPSYILLAIMQSLVGTIRGAGKTMVTMIISILSLCVIRVLWIMLVLKVNPSIEGVFYGYPISWFVGAILSIIYAFRGKWIPQHKLSSEKQEG